MIPPQFDADGLLPPGVHWANWDELTDRLGNNPWRQHLMTGLRSALENLKGAGCRTVYINGSFVTSNAYPMLRRLLGRSLVSTRRLSTPFS